MGDDKPAESRRGGVTARASLSDRENGLSKLFSIGYADHDPESLVALLKDSGVQVVVDVRANPVSRKKGFSKNQLADALGAAGIEYRSIRKLGIPTSDRNAATGGASAWNELLAAYAESLNASEQRGSAAESLAEDCQNSATAIMCLESDLDHCHRKPLSEWISKKTGLELVHL